MTCKLAALRHWLHVEEFSNQLFRMGSTDPFHNLAAASPSRIRFFLPCCVFRDSCNEGQRLEEEDFAEEESLTLFNQSLNYFLDRGYNVSTQHVCSTPPALTLTITKTMPMQMDGLNESTRTSAEQIRLAVDQHRISNREIEEEESDDELVMRTGEASRLRRRGAIIRIDPTNSRQRDDIDTADMHCRALYCGSEPRPVPSWTRHTTGKFTPSPLPLYPSRNRSPSPERPPKTTSSGCGALIHPRAYCASASGMWTALTSASSESFMPLDASYVSEPLDDESEEEVRRRVRTYACGCETKAIACVSWCVRA